MGIVKRDHTGKDTNPKLERGKNSNKAKNFKQEVDKRSQKLKGMEKNPYHPQHPTNK
jgi:hypothetical protein